MTMRNGAQQEDATRNVAQGLLIEANDEVRELAYVLSEGAEALAQRETRRAIGILREAAERPNAASEAMEAARLLALRSLRSGATAGRTATTQEPAR